MSNDVIKRFEKNNRFSRVVVHNGTAYFAGLTADDRSQDAFGQTKQILAKAEALLAMINADKSRLLTATVWLKDISDFQKMNDAWVGWIDAEAPPARATVQSELGLPDILVEIQFVAAV